MVVLYHSFLPIFLREEEHQWHLVLWFSSWAVLFSSSCPFVPHLLSRGPFPMLIITIFLSWDPLHSPYTPSNPYAIPCITTRQGISFCLLLLSDGHLLLQPILSYWLHTPFTHSFLYDIPWHSVLTQWNVLPCSAMFFHLLSRSLLEYISPCTYSVLLICAIHTLHCWKMT